MSKKVKTETKVNVPYLHIRYLNEKHYIQGLISCSLGHKIDRPAQAEPDGIFAEWSWNGERLSVCNDRYGFYPLYYFTKPGEIAISTSIPKLVELGAPVTLNDTALALFLRLGFFIGEDTAFKFIRAVPPCSNFVWEDGNLRFVREWPTVKANRLSRSSAIDAYISLFRQAIQRRLPPDDNYIVPISGGVDSRHILLELCAAGFSPKSCMTVQGHPSTSSEDLKISQQLSAALDLKHILVSQPKSRLAAELKKNLITSFSSTEHAWYLAIGDYLRGKTNITYSGGAGDTLSEGTYLKRELLEHFEHNRFSELAERLLTGARERFIASALPVKRYRELNRRLAINRLTEELKQYAATPNHLGSFYFANRIRRSSVHLSCSILSGIKTVFMPYLDYDLYNFLASLPAGMLLDGRFHADALLRAYPAYAQIPFSDKQKEIRYSWRYAVRFASELMRYAYQNHASESVRSLFLLPRLLRCAIDKSYSKDINYFGTLAVYLIQLERLKSVLGK